jgi:hypothetical protein
MGSGAAYYSKPTNHNLSILNRDFKLLVFTIKKYDVEKQLTAHT